MEQSRTVVEAKLAFLRQQIRLLSAQLQPSAQWHDDVAQIDEPDLGDKVVEEAMNKLNARLKHHNRLVYSTESTRHVAEQIDVLYWNAVSNSGNEAELDTDLNFPLDKSVDLTKHEIIQLLPASLADPDSADAEQILVDDMEAYAATRSRLMEAYERQKSTNSRLEQLKALQQLLGPYKDPQKSIQPNLVTRNGELGKELDRMRVLLARVTGAIQQQNMSGHTKNKASESVNGHKSRATTEREKLDAIMDMT